MKTLRQSRLHPLRLVPGCALVVLSMLAVSCSAIAPSEAVRSEAATSIGEANTETGGSTGADDEADEADPTLEDFESPEPEDPDSGTSDSEDPDSGTSDPEEETSMVEDNELRPEITIAEIGWPLPSGAAAPEPATDPLPVDPNLRTGELENGLRWYAQSNDSPGQSVSMRLSVDAGSIQQDEPQSGLAHFVEHMMFNGTEKYPANTLETDLSALGATIGPDLNAFTSADETVYQLDLQSNDLETLYIGLDVLFEWASNAIIDDAEVAAEIGVVREEIRLSDEVATAPVDEMFDLAYTQGTQYENAGPGGIIEEINLITTEDARRYYDRWYRPDNMAVVVVGDYPIDTLVQAIEETQGGLVARGPAPEWQRDPVPLITEPFVEVLELPAGGRSFISIDWAIPTWDISTTGGERMFFVESLIGLIMENRLQDRVDSGEYEMFEPTVGRFDWNRERAFIGLNVDAPDLALGTSQILAEFVGAADQGFTDAEVERATAIYRSIIESQSDEQVFDFTLADRYAFDFLNGADKSTRSDQIERHLSLLDDLEAPELSSYLSWMLSASAPLVIIVTDRADITPTRQEMLHAIADSVPMGLGLEGGTDSGAAVLDRLIEPPQPVEAVSTTEPGGTDRLTTVAEYPNGAKLIVVESQIERDQVYLEAYSSGGWSTLNQGDAAVFDLVIDAVDRSGVGPHDAPSVLRYLERRQAGLTATIGDSSEGFYGAASTEDTEVLFELMYMTMTAPRVDTVALEQAKRAAVDGIELVEIDPGTALFVEASRARFSDNPWYEQIPTPERVESLTSTEALQLFVERFGAVDDLELYIYGDVDTDEVLRMGDTWVGTLPARDVPDQAIDVGSQPPEGVVTREVRIGTADGSGAVLMRFATPGEVTNQDRITMEFLRAILDSRLFFSLREELSVTYGGSVSVRTVEEPAAYIESDILVNGDPNRVLEIRDAILVELNDLAANGPTAEEFERNFNVLDTDYGFIDNGFLYYQAEAKARGREAIDSQYRYRLLDAVTPEMLQEMTQRMFPVDQRIDVIRLPG